MKYCIFLILFVFSLSSFSESLKLAAFHVCEKDLTLVKNSDCKKRRVKGLRQKLILKKEATSINCEGRIYSYIGDKVCISEVLEVGENAPERSDDDDSRHMISLSKWISKVNLNTEKDRKEILNIVNPRTH